MATKQTILVVDDEPKLLDVLVFDLEDAGYNTLTANCGNEALEVFKNNKVDAILSDIRMPNGTGIDLLEGIRKISIDQPVVLFITAYTDMSLEDAYDRGADAVFAKPIHIDQLIDAVRRCLKDKNERWNNRASRVDAEIKITLKNSGSDLSMNTRAVNLGRGGFFAEFPADAIPPIGRVIAFTIPANAFSLQEISGEGVVRWNRSNDAELPSGAGIEFTLLAGAGRSAMVELINAVKTKSFIPKR